MDEIKKLVKKDPITKVKICEQLDIMKTENLATRDAFLKEMIVSNTVNTEALHRAGEVMFDMQEEIYEKDEVISYYKNIVGDENVHQEAIEKAHNKIKEYHSYEENRVKTKNDIIKRMLKKQQLVLKQK